jgi:hypothetical protein
MVSGQGIVRTLGFIDYFQMRASRPIPTLPGQHHVSSHSSRRLLVVFELRQGIVSRHCGALLARVQVCVAATVSDR